jgi:hypothetical protein
MPEDETPPYRYIEYAEELLNDRVRINNLGPATRENLMLEALANAVLAIAKMMGRGRA